jgi:hypothetical protein
MATRNQRRKAAKARALAKAVRVINAKESKARQARLAIVQANLKEPFERNYWEGITSFRHGYAAETHRGYRADSSDILKPRRVLNLSNDRVKK